MIVPNYIPEPIEVPHSISEERYPVRLAFIRRVTLLHFASVGIVALLALLPWPAVGVLQVSVVLAGLLITLDAVRVAKRGDPSEARQSVWLLPLVLVLVSWWVRELSLTGIPAWAPAVGLACALVYTLLCGRDYSFVGCWVLTFIASTVILAAMIDYRQGVPREATWALGLNLAYLTYHIYDLASLLARRRRGEELAAVVDLYRDVFNIFGYLPRVIGHWRKHRIWVVPK